MLQHSMGAWLLAGKAFHTMLLRVPPAYSAWLRGGSLVGAMQMCFHLQSKTCRSFYQAASCSALMAGCWQWLQLPLGNKQAQQSHSR